MSGRKIISGAPPAGASKEHLLTFSSKKRHVDIE
jgi:hypothetical protein